MMKKNESGRSMVEMLGVLAIIGVLSVGGIAGYTIAMRRYRANEALDMASKYATIVYSGKVTHDTLQRDGDYDVPSLYDTGLTTDSAHVSQYAGATISDATIPNNAEGVNLTITFPSDDVCKTAEAILGTPKKWNGTAKADTTCNGKALELFLDNN